jgi:hypothetical protein
MDNMRKFLMILTRVCLCPKYCVKFLVIDEDEYGALVE